MKWCVSFPEENVLVVRPCLNVICAGVKPAAKLLSVLLYRYSVRQEHKEDAENINEAKVARGEEPTQDTTFRIYRKQAQLVIDMCNEITEKTLHDVAVPTLQLLGFLDVDESSPIHCYDVHLDVVNGAIEALKQGPKQLEKFLIGHLQLEKFLITTSLEKLLINKKYFQFNKKYFQLALEKVLIANRNISNNKRGRKPSSEVVSEGVFEEPQITIDTIEIIKDSNRDSFASPDVDAEPSDFSFQEIPVTYAEAVAYLKPHGPHYELDAVQTMKLAQKLWVEAHENDDEPTVKALAIPKIPSTSTPAQDIPPVVEAAVLEQAAPGNDENESQYPQQQTLVAPAASKSRARQARKAVEPELTPDELTLQARCSKWYDRVTDWCGGPMTRGGQVINEHRSIKLACQKYSDTQLEAIFKYVTTRDWKYSKIDNKYTVRCYVLWDESGRVAQILKEERQSGQCSQPASNAPRFAANMPANLGNEPLVVWKPPTKTKQPVTARGR